MNPIEVIQPGSPVLVGENIKATVLSVKVGDKKCVSYECSWWDGRNRHVDWFEQIEVERTRDAQGIRIGFSS